MHMAKEHRPPNNVDGVIPGETERLSQTLTRRLRELPERYGTPMPQMFSRVAELEAKVNPHLERIGFSWQ